VRPCHRGGGGADQMLEMRLVTSLMTSAVARTGVYPSLRGEWPGLFTLEEEEEEWTLAAPSEGC